MRLLEAIVNNYRCVGSNCVLSLDHKITALVGKSETGKTTILKALQRFFDRDAYGANEACSWAPPADDHVMCAIRFEPNEEERNVLGQLDQSFSSAQSIVIAKLKDGTHKIVEPDVGTSTTLKPSDKFVRRIQNLRARARTLLRLTAAFLSAYGDNELQTAATVFRDEVNVRKILHPHTTPELQKAALSEAISQLDAYVARVTTLQAHAENPARILRTRAVRLRNDIHRTADQIEFEGQEASAVPIEAVLDLLPRALLVSDKDIQPIADVVPLSELTSEKHSAILNLLALGKIAEAGLAIEDETERNRRLHWGAEAASRALTQRWSQEEVKVTFDVSGGMLRLGFISEEGHYGNPSQRSEGFLWFLTFLLNFASDAPQEGGTLFLLDEPGIHLHASAQGDLLRLLETIAGHSQMVYTTHSPYMINKNFPWRIRAVRKNRRGVDPQGTCVDSKPYASATGRAWEPIRSSIGLSSGNSLFLAGKNLVVEGISDQIILAALSQRLSRDGGPSVDLDRICITPAGGADKVYALAHLCHAEAEVTVVLLDSDQQGDRVKKRIEAGRVFPPGKVLQVGDIALAGKRKAIDLEDLVDVRFYHAAVVEAYSRVPPRPELPESFEDVKAQAAPGQTKSEASPAKTSVKKTYQNFFRSKGDEWGDFDNVLVARQLAETCLNEDNPPVGLQETFDNFSKLFNKINSLV